MQISIRTNSVIHIVDISGGFNLADAETLKELIMKMIEKKAERFILNMDGVTSFDAAGAGALIYISSTLRKMNFKLALANVAGSVKEVLDQTRLAGYFAIYDTAAEAIKALE